MENPNAYLQFLPQMQQISQLMPGLTYTSGNNIFPHKNRRLGG